jgi:hypothetical protein
MFLIDHETPVDLLYYDAIAETLVKRVIDPTVLWRTPDRPLRAPAGIPSVRVSLLNQHTT